MSRTIHPWWYGGKFKRNPDVLKDSRDLTWEEVGAMIDVHDVAFLPASASSSGKCEAVVRDAKGLFYQGAHDDPKMAIYLAVQSMKACNLVKDE